jgi:hypothetical protein
MLQSFKISNPVLLLNNVLNELGLSNPIAKQVSVMLIPFFKYSFDFSIRLSVKYCFGVCP